jgi:hypothetical protein
VPRNPLAIFALEAFLGRDAGQAVNTAAQWLEHATATTRITPDEKNPDLRLELLRPREAAVKAARLALPQLAAKANARAEVNEAIATICDALDAVERTLRIVTPRQRRGRRGASEQARMFEARAVYAVNWLQRLKWQPMSRDDAIAAVAEMVPEPMRTYRRKEYTGEERLISWLNDYSRADCSPARVIARKNVEFEVWEKYFRTWRDPVLSRKGDPVRNEADGTILYGDEREMDETDATREDVLAWLRGNKSAK